MRPCATHAEHTPAERAASSPPRTVYLGTYPKCVDMRCSLDTGCQVCGQRTTLAPNQSRRPAVLWRKRSISSQSNRISRGNLFSFIRTRGTSMLRATCSNENTWTAERMIVVLAQRSRHSGALSLRDHDIQRCLSLRPWAFLLRGASIGRTRYPLTG